MTPRVGLIRLRKCDFPHFAAPHLSTIAMCGELAADASIRHICWFPDQPDSLSLQLERDTGCDDGGSSMTWNCGRELEGGMEERSVCMLQPPRGGRHMWHIPCLL